MLESPDSVNLAGEFLVALQCTLLLNFNPMSLNLRCELPGLTGLVVL